MKRVILILLCFSVLFNVFLIGNFIIFKRSDKNNRPEKSEIYDSYKWAYCFNLLRVDFQKKCNPIMPSDSSFAELTIAVDDLINPYDNRRVFATYCFIIEDSLDINIDEFSYNNYFESKYATDTAYFNNFSMKLKSAPTVAGKYVAIGKVQIPKVCWSCDKREYLILPFSFKFTIS